MISLIIPSYNNLRHLKNVYESVKKHAPTAELVLLDDGSTDGTWEWILNLAEEHQHREVKAFKSETRVGHTILYDKGIELATNEIVGILHADMIIGPNYVENILKHLKPGTVVCGTRIEPPLHPEGKEKIIKDFGLDFDTLDIKAFEDFCNDVQLEFKNQTTKGMFAPWVIYKKDFQSIGGHDPLFAPFPYEDSDIFQRWILAGYKLIQSRDAFVYHLTCRGHRWTDKIGENDDYFKIVSERARKNYMRKWGSWIQNDEFQYPIITPKYNIAFKITNCTYQLLEALEPLCDRIYTDCPHSSEYVKKEQPNTDYDLTKRVLEADLNDPIAENDIVVEFDARKLTQRHFELLQALPKIIKDSGEIGTFELEDFTITINNIEEYQDNLVKLLK